MYSVEIKNNKEIYEFCRVNGIIDINKFVQECFKQGFDIKKYGLLSGDLPKTNEVIEKIVEVEKLIEVPVEKIVEKVVEVPIEKIVEKVVTSAPQVVEKVVEKVVVATAVPAPAKPAAAKVLRINLGAFPDKNISIKPQAGDMILHKSELKHGVNEVTEGTRYYSTAFLFDD